MLEGYVAHKISTTRNVIAVAAKRQSWIFFLFEPRKHYVVEILIVRTL